MRISKVVYGVGLTINMGNYQTARPEARVEVDLNEGDNVEEAMKLARDSALKLFASSGSDAETIHNLADRYKGNYPMHIYSEMIEATEEPE